MQASAALDKATIEIDGQPLLAHTRVRRDRVDQTGAAAMRCSMYVYLVRRIAAAPGLVDTVTADPGVGQERLSVDLDGGLVEGTPGLHGRATSGGMRTLFVVDVDEAVDLGLELGEGSTSRFFVPATS